MKTLVVTGLFNPLGTEVAKWAVDAGVRVLGVDIKPMTRPFAGIEFIHADIRNPLFPKLLKAEQVDAIFHSAFRWRVRRSEAIFESNVMGTMKLLGAASLAGVKKVVFPSSTFVYGAHITNPLYMTEENEFQGRPGYAFVRDLRDIETFINGFRHQNPEMTITVLRFANILGRNYPSPLARYLSLPIAPTLMGYDPLLQVIHRNDVLQTLTQALLEDHNGAFNIAAPDPLPLCKMLRLCRTPAMPILHPLAYSGFRWTRMLSKKADALVPIPWDYLRYSWTASIEKAEAEWGFSPSHDGEATVRQVAADLYEHRKKHSILYKATHGGLRFSKQAASSPVGGDESPNAPGL